MSAHSATDADVPSGGPASSTEDDGHRTIAAGICLGSIGLFILIATDWFVAGISLAFLGFVLAFGARQQRADAAVKREASDT